MFTKKMADQNIEMGLLACRIIDKDNVEPLNHRPDKDRVLKEMADKFPDVSPARRRRAVSKAIMRLRAEKVKVRARNR